MKRMYCVAGRFAPAEASTWCGRNRLDPDRLFRTEDDAMLEACRRLAAMSTGRDPAPRGRRTEAGSLVIRTDVTFVIRGRGNEWAFAYLKNAFLAAQRFERKADARETMLKASQEP